MGYNWSNDIYAAYRGDKRIDCEAMAVMQAIAHCMFDSDSTAYPSRATIAEMAHISTSTVSSRIEKLFGMGILKWKTGTYDKEQRMQLSNEYEFVFPDGYIRQSQAKKGKNGRKPRTPPVRGTDYPPPQHGLPPRPQHGLPPSAARTTPVRSTDTNNNISNIQQQSNNDNTLTLRPPEGEMIDISDISLKDVFKNARTSTAVQVRPLEEQSPTAMFCNFCNSHDRDTISKFTNVSLHKDCSAVIEKLYELHSCKRQGEYNNIKNLLAFGLSELSKLPNVR